MAVVQGIWNFISRHRKKFIFTGIVAGGVYYYVKVKLPKIQEDLFQSLLKELSEGTASSNGQADAQQRRASFQRHQEVSDSYARKGLRKFLERHQECFKVEECQGALAALTRAKAANDRKVAAFRELQVECLSLVASAVYSLYIILLLHRLQFNLAAREKTLESEAAQELINSTEFFLEKGADRVATSTRRAVQALQLQPESKVTVTELSGVFQEVFEKLEEDLWADSKGSSLLPPDAAASKASPLLDEARDYLESPQLLQAARTLAKAGAERLPHMLVKTGGKASGLKDGGSVPLASLFGGCILLGRQIFEEATEPAEADANVFIQSFADQTVVSQFCEALYFQEATTK